MKRGRSLSTKKRSGWISPTASTSPTSRSSISRIPRAPHEVELTINKDRTEPYNLGDGYGHVAFVVEDLDAEHRRFEAEGLKPRKIVEFNNGGKLIARFFFVEDPDGYKIEVLQKARPLPVAAAAKQSDKKTGGNPMTHNETTPTRAGGFQTRVPAAIRARFRRRHRDHFDRRPAQRLRSVGARRQGSEARDDEDPDPRRARHLPARQGRRPLLRGRDETL